MDKKKMERELYYHLEKKYKKKKTIRFLYAVFFVAIIYCLMFYNVLNEIKNIEEGLLFIVAIIIAALADIYVHIIIFHFTLEKNKEESIELEKLRNELENN